VNYRATSRVNPDLKDIDEAIALQRADMNSMTKKVDQAFRANERKLFSTEGAFGGPKWPKPIHKAYRKWKLKKYGSRKTMVLTGETRKSLTSKGGKHVARYNMRPRTRIVLGTTVKTPAYHIADSPLKNPKIAANRDVMQHSEGQYQHYMDLIAEYYREVKMPQVRKILRRWRKHRGRGV